MDRAIAACGGDTRGTIKALILANEYLQAEVRELQAAISNGFARGKLPSRATGRIGMTRVCLEYCPSSSASLNAEDFLGI